MTFLYMYMYMYYILESFYAEGNICMSIQAITIIYITKHIKRI